MPKYGDLILVIVFFVISSVTTSGMEKVKVEELGSVKHYTISSKQEGYLSRDGSYAMQVKKGTQINQPGNYFLSYYDEMGNFHIQKFTVPVARESSLYSVKNQTELTEAIKSILENHKTQAIIKVNYGNWSLEGMSSLLGEVFEDVIYTYPDITYDRYQFTTQIGYKPTVEIKVTYPTVRKQFQEYALLADEKILQIINECITSDMKDYERQNAIIQYVVNHLEYVPEGDNSMKHTLQGAVIDGKAVCDGYSHMSMYLLNAVGVPTTFVVGVASDEAHAWNKVSIQGDYYHMDATWADQDEEAMTSFLHYINETDEYMQRTHTWDTARTPSAVSTRYSSIYRPIEASDVYRVKNLSEWRNVQKKIASDQLEAATILLYEVQKNLWTEQDILETIVACEQDGIEYLVEYKYDTMVVTYKTYK